MNIEHLKLDAREKILKFAMNKQSNLEDLEILADTLIDKVVDAVEESVIHDINMGRIPRADENPPAVVREIQQELIQAFRSFRGL